VNDAVMSSATGTHRSYLPHSGVEAVGTLVFRQGRMSIKKAIYMQSKVLIFQPAAQPESLTAKDFENAKVLSVDAPEMTFYVAQDSDKTIQGTVLIKPNDRLATGALVGNWIASGFSVQRLTYKALNKLMRDLQKEKDASAVIVQSDSPASTDAKDSGEPTASSNESASPVSTEDANKPD